MKHEDLKKKDELLARKRVLQSLLDHPGWALFCEAVDRVILARRMMVFGSNLSTLEDIAQLIRTRGEIAGLMVSKEIPRALLNDMEADLAVILRAEEVGDE